MKKIFLFLIVFLFAVPSAHAYVSFTASGFGNSFENGVYCDDSNNVNGVPSYKLVGASYYLYYSGLLGGGVEYNYIGNNEISAADYFKITPTPGDFGNGGYSWQVNIGASPAGTVVSGSTGCDPAPPPPAIVKSQIQGFSGGLVFFWFIVEAFTVTGIMVTVSLFIFVVVKAIGGLIRFFKI